MCLVNCDKKPGISSFLERHSVACILVSMMINLYGAFTSSAGASGYSVVEAENGAEGLLASAKPTDVVITDNRCRGWCLEMSIKLRRAFPTARIIACLGGKEPQHAKTLVQYTLRSRFVWRNYWIQCKQLASAAGTLGVKHSSGCSHDIQVGHKPSNMAQIFHPSTNTISRVQHFGSGVLSLQGCCGSWQR